MKRIAANAPRESARLRANLVARKMEKRAKQN